MLPFTPLERTVEVEVPVDAAQQPLIGYLTERYNYLNCEQWQEQIAVGNLFVNGVTAASERIVVPHDVIFFQARDLVEQDVSWAITVLAETDDYIVVNKPGNLPCHPAGRFFNHTLWAWLMQAHHLNSIHFVNRLDRETSGIVLVGKSPRFAAEASKYLHAMGGQSRKEYAVMVHGRVPYESFTTNGFLVKDTLSAVHKKRRFLPMKNDGDSDVVELPEDDIDAVTSQTDFFHRGYYSPVLDADGMAEQFRADPNGQFTLLSAVLHTGRTHQIRATLCSLGYPLVGDKLYGVDETIFLRFANSTLGQSDWQRLIMHHQALHAHHLVIKALGIDVAAPIPWLC